VLVPACLQSAPAEANGAKQEKPGRQVALLEAQIRRLLELLGTVLEDTKANVEKKLARTYEELQAELNEADQVLRIKQHAGSIAAVSERPCLCCMPV